jgi:hypothetical protein
VIYLDMLAGKVGDGVEVGQIGSWRGHCGRRTGRRVDWQAEIPEIRFAVSGCAPEESDIILRLNPDKSQ